MSNQLKPEARNGRKPAILAAENTFEWLNRPEKGGGAVKQKNYGSTVCSSTYMKQFQSRMLTGSCQLALKNLTRIPVNRTV